MTQEITELLNDHGLLASSEARPSRLALALSPLLLDRPGDGQILLALASGLEEALRRFTKSSLLLAKLLAHLHRLTGMKSSKLAVVLASAAPELVKSLSWVTKLQKAGEVLLQWPQLEDVNSIDKLATLKRIPKKLQQEIFTSGNLPGGSWFRDLDPGQLSEAINFLRAGSCNQVPLNPYREARKQLIKLVNGFNPVCSQLAQVPGYLAIVEQILAMQQELIKIIEGTAVTPRLPFQNVQQWQSA